MKLSIIIVNYNVKYFLQQLLLSIRRSKTTFTFEIIVVDNASTDGSEAMIQKEFEEVQYLYNKKNLGFSKANNQAISQSKGIYVLLLNPDTIIEEDTLEKSVSFMDQHKNCGALGVRMIDGGGQYLAESKRGFPKPSVAFYKAFGLAALFPKSRTFNEYYLGHLPEDQINEVDVLTGAFMLLRKSVLEEVGVLDEQFFMYGEDIDLSYRIKQAGYVVYYYPLTTIIHFKGESTKKDSLQYVRRFYGAMKRFARKHYSGKKEFSMTWVLNVAIYLRASLTIIKYLLVKYGLMAFDFFVVGMVLFGFSRMWATFYFNDPQYYHGSPMIINVLLYSGIWVMTLFLTGAYDKPFDGKRLLKGWILGWVIVAVLYGFFAAPLRSSRIMVLAGGVLSIAVYVFIRSLFSRTIRGRWLFARPGLLRFIIVGDGPEAARIHDLIQSNRPSYQFQGVVSPIAKSTNSSIGTMDQLDQISRFYQVDEIIFCSKNVASSEIMKWMTKLGDQISYKIAPDQSTSIIGSKSKNDPGELYTVEVNYQIDDPTLRRNKRILDIFLALALLIGWPFVIGMVERRSRFTKNIFDVLLGRKTWVSYASSNADMSFPVIRPGVISTSIGLKDCSDTKVIRELDYHYARDYKIIEDLTLITTNIKHLGS